MRRCFDSTSVGGLAPGADIYAGYDDGSYNDAAAIAAAEHKTVIRITVFPSDNEGDVLDVEKGDATPAQAPAWVAKRRAAGHPGPGVYCSLAAWADVKAAFAAAKVAPPWYWLAAYPGNGANLYAGSSAHQWVDHGGYDESVMVDYLVGIDPAPLQPTGPLTQGENEVNITVIESANDGNRHVFVYDDATHAVTHFYQQMHPADGKSFQWTREVLGTAA